MCPQQDVLFDNLTVLEHLLLFASIKAPQCTQKELRQQVHKSVTVTYLLLPPSTLCELVKGIERGALQKSPMSMFMRREN